MKRIFISTILSAVALNAFAAEAPKVKVEGRMEFQAATINEKKFKNTNPADNTKGFALNRGAFVNDTKIDIHADGRINKDVTYGGMIRLHADTSAATNQETTVGDKTMIYFQNDKIGRIEGGNIFGAAAAFEMQVSNFGVGSWGVDGFTPQFIQDRTYQTSQKFNTDLGGGNSLRSLNEAAGVRAGLGVQNTRGLEFTTYANLPSNYSGHHYSDAPKINLFTKPIPEITLGVTFIPDMDSAGTVRGMASKNAGPADAARQSNPATFRDIISAGLMYDKKFNKDWNLKAVVAGEVGKAKTIGINDLRAYEAGFMAGYKNYKFGATYGSWTKSLTLKQKVAGTKQGSAYWSAGFAHQIEKFGYSVTYINSRKAGGIESLTLRTREALVAAGAGGLVPSITNNFFSDVAYNKFQNVALDLDYQLAPGLLPYATVSAYQFKEGGGTKSNGRIMMLGTRLLF